MLKKAQICLGAVTKGERCCNAACQNDKGNTNGGLPVIVCYGKLSNEAISLEVPGARGAGNWHSVSASHKEAWG